MRAPTGTRAAKRERQERNLAKAGAFRPIDARRFGAARAKLPKAERSFASIARRAGMFEQTVRDIAIGKQKSIRVNIGRALQRALGVSEVELFGTPSGALYDAHLFDLLEMPDEQRATGGGTVGSPGEDRYVTAREQLAKRLPDDYRGKKGATYGYGLLLGACSLASWRAAFGLPCDDLTDAEVGKFAELAADMMRLVWKDARTHGLDAEGVRALLHLIGRDRRKRK
jgi:transcriptional regulator with XRE-family HTH domain